MDNSVYLVYEVCVNINKVQIEPRRKNIRTANLYFLTSKAYLPLW